MLSWHLRRWGSPGNVASMYTPGLDFALEKAWERWIYRGRRPVGRPLSGEPGWVLSYTARYRVSITLIFLMFSSMYTYLFFVNDLFAEDPDWKRWGIKAGSALLWALVTAVFVSMLAERVTVTERGITRRSWRGTQSLDWPAIVQIEAKAPEGILVLGDGTSRISVSLYLDGLLSMMPFLSSTTVRSFRKRSASCFRERPDPCPPPASSFVSLIPSHPTVLTCGPKRPREDSLMTAQSPARPARGSRLQEAIPKEAVK